MQEASSWAKIILLFSKLGYAFITNQQHYQATKLEINKGIGM
jgi:hypothetical protein